MSEVRRKTNCVVFDEDKIRKMIYLYGDENNKYLIMNEQTYNKLKAENSYTFDGQTKYWARIVPGYNEYMGLPIAICNKLELGEVEIV